MVRSSRGADARLPSAVQIASFASGVTGIFSCASSMAIHSAAQLRSPALSTCASGWKASPSSLASVEPSAWWAPPIASTAARALLPLSKM